MPFFKGDNCETMSIGCLSSQQLGPQVGFKVQKYVRKMLKILCSGTNAQEVNIYTKACTYSEDSKL